MFSKILFYLYRLELKLSALGEKKSALKAQLQQTTRTMSNLRSSLSEEEKKKVEAKSHASRMEALVRNYEEKNQELEEREMEVRYRLQMLENTMPALMMWNMWRVMYQMQGAPAGGAATSQPTPQPPVPTYSAGNHLPPNVKAAIEREEDIVVKLKGLETKLANEEYQLEESREAEDLLKKKVRELERLLNTKEDSFAGAMNSQGSQLQNTEVFDKLSKMVKDRLEMDKRIKDLEHKEKLYQETLQQADSMFAEMEGGYTQQIQEKDEELKKKEQVLKERDMILRKYSAESVITSQLQEKIDALEGEVNRLKNSLSKREQEREMLEGEEQRLYKELQDCLEQLDDIKKNVEGPLRGELEAEKRRLRELDSTIKRKEKELEKKDEEHNKEVPSQSKTNKKTLESHVESLRKSQVPQKDVEALSKTISAQQTASRMLTSASPYIQPNAITVGAIHVFVYLFMALIAIKFSVTS
jgi:chromosome segregation ATPase